MVKFSASKNQLNLDVYKFLVFLTSVETSSGKFDYLDGYRGSLALWVLMHHACYFLNMNKNDYRFFDLLGYFIGVIGFFLLSAFLLTYRMICQLCETKFKLSKILLILTQYYIRRFFRVYIPFFLVVTLIKFVSPKFGGPYKYTTSWSSLVSLQSAGVTVVWTIAPEIKYYFFIPLFCLITVLMNRLWFIWDICLIVSLYMIESKKLFAPYSNYKLEHGYLFLTRFTVFYLGSILAVLYFRLKNSFLFKYFQVNYVRLIFGLVAVVIYSYGFKLWSPLYNKKLNFENYTFKSGLFYSILMGIMLVGSPNFFTNFFNSSILKYAGRYSLGIYLLHPMCIVYVKSNIRKGEAEFELLVYTILASYFAGFLFFYVIENPLMKLSDFLCSKVKKYFEIKRTYSMVPQIDI